MDALQTGGAAMDVAFAGRGVVAHGKDASTVEASAGDAGAKEWGEGERAERALKSEELADDFLKDSVDFRG